MIIQTARNLKKSIKDKKLNDEEYMTSNLERYKADLEKLIKKGKSLYISIRKECDFQDNDLPAESIHSNFQEEYQEWYSEALAVIKQIIPDRKEDFIRIYNQNSENYTLTDYITGVKKNPRIGHYTMAPSLFQQQLGILKSAQKKFESSLFDIKQLLQADLFDSELDAAMELNKKGFIRAAGAVAGVVLESHLKQVCKNHKITITKRNPTISYLNDLLKTERVIDVPKHRNIQLLADWRNLCDHDKETNPSKENVTKLIEGINEIIKTLF